MVSITERNWDVFISMDSGDMYLKKNMARSGMNDGQLVLFYTKPNAFYSKIPILKVNDIKDIGVITDAVGNVLQPQTLSEAATMIADFFN